MYDKFKKYCLILKWDQYIMVCYIILLFIHPRMYALDPDFHLFSLRVSMFRDFSWLCTQIWVQERLGELLKMSGIKPQPVAWKAKSALYDLQPLSFVLLPCSVSWEDKFDWITIWHWLVSGWVDTIGNSQPQSAIRGESNQCVPPPLCLCLPWKPCCATAVGLVRLVC